jgi:hypothetical protein
MKLLLHGPQRLRLLRFICYVHRREKNPRGVIFWEVIGAAKYAYLHMVLALGRGLRV